MAKAMGRDPAIILHLTEENQDLKRRLAQKDRFMAEVSHELRTPLTNIIGFAELLLYQFSDGFSANQKEYVQFILDSGQHLLHMINDLLDLAKIEAGKLSLEKKEMPVNDMIQACLKLFGKKAQDRLVHLCCDLTENTATISADPRRFRQIISNLLENAIGYTPSGGRVGVECRRGDDGLQFTIWDTGNRWLKEN